MFNPNAETVFADGPSNNPKQPPKSEIRKLLGQYEGFISAFVSIGGLVYDTRASLFADLGRAASASAWVIADATVAYNGIYRKLGASGSGSWTRVADLPYSFIRLNDAGAGSANAIQATSAIPLPGAASAALLVMNIAAANTGAVTLAANGAAPKPVKTASGGDLAAGYLAAGMMVTFVDDGANYRLLSDVASAAIQAVAVAAAVAAQASEQNVATSATNAATSAASAAGSAAAAATSAAALTFNFATATADANPGNGAFRLNNAAMASATAAYVGNVDSDGATAAAILDSWDDSTNTVRGVLTIRSKANATIRHTFNVTGSVVDGTGYRKLTLAYVGGAGTLANGGAHWLIFDRAGDAGEVTLAGAQTLTNKTLDKPTLTLKQAATPTPTALGDIQFGTDNKVLEIGDGAASRTFVPIPANAVAGDIEYFTGAKAKARLAKGAAGQVLQMNVGATAPLWATPAAPDYASGIAELSYGAIGTYAYAAPVTGSSAAFASGATLAGSSLNVIGSLIGASGAQRGAALTGTWRCMGYAVRNTGETLTSGTLWLRIA